MNCEPLVNIHAVPFKRTQVTSCTGSAAKNAHRRVLPKTKFLSRRLIFEESLDDSDQPALLPLFRRRPTDSYSHSHITTSSIITCDGLWTQCLLRALLARCVLGADAKSVVKWCLLFFRAPHSCPSSMYSGTIPQELGSLTLLESLWLKHNKGFKCECKSNAFFELTHRGAGKFHIALLSKSNVAHTLACRSCAHDSDGPRARKDERSRRL